MYDIDAIHRYYLSSEGQKTAQQLASDVRLLWPEQNSENTPDQNNINEVAIGFPFPFLPQLRLPPVLMPTSLDAPPWQGPRGVINAQIDPECWPISSDIMDRIFIAHALEFAPDPAAFLCEAARVLSGAGRLLIMVPHRRGLWARSRRTPFGHGASYSRGQLYRLLLDCGLQPMKFHRSLISPPEKKLPEKKWAKPVKSSMERLGGGVARVLSGVLLVEATKMVYVKRMVHASHVPRRLIGLQGKPVLPNTVSSLQNRVTDDK